MFDKNVITMSVIIARGMLVDTVARTTTKMFMPGNTPEQNKEEAAKVVQWMRDTADEWEESFASELSETSEEL